jgi:DNA-binding transcriptional regulator YdaS (Cro superfamily)
MILVQTNSEVNMSTRTAMRKAVKICGKRGLARALGLAYQSVNRYAEQNRLPDSEYSGRTLHALAIEKATEGQVTITDLLGWIPNHNKWPA